MLDKVAMRVGIMQPYYFPYIGYFQLIAAVDVFVLYDNIKYTKKGWINRNRILQNGIDVVFSLPLKAGSDSLDVRDRQLAGTFDPSKLLHQLRASYHRAPYFSETMDLVREVQSFGDRNLYSFLAHSIGCICSHLGLATEIRVSSGVAIDHTLKGEDKVLAICEAVGAKTYINSIGGVDLYSRETFERRGVMLQFLRSTPFVYSQNQETFIPWLSIIDVLMFNSIEATRDALHNNFEMN